MRLLTLYLQLVEKLATTGVKLFIMLAIAFGKLLRWLFERHQAKRRQGQWKKRKR